VLGISVDSFAANKRFATDLNLTFPLLSDFMRTVSKEYGVLDEAHGVARRVTFVIDKQGIIRHIDAGKEAIDPKGAHQACGLLDKK
jgi:peroxiredoxin